MEKRMLNNDHTTVTNCTNVRRTGWKVTTQTESHLWRIEEIKIYDFFSGGDECFEWWRSSKVKAWILLKKFNWTLPRMNTLSSCFDLFVQIKQYSCTYLLLVKLGFYWNKGQYFFVSDLNSQNCAPTAAEDKRRTLTWNLNNWINQSKLKPISNLFQFLWQNVSIC